MVLCEEELVCVDLTEKRWPLISLPYLHPIHSSQITCNIHRSNIEEHVWKVSAEICNHVILLVIFVGMSLSSARLSLYQSGISSISHRVETAFPQQLSVLLDPQRP